MIKELLQLYKQNKIDSIEFGKRMSNIHEVLLEYPQLINDSIIEKLEITKEKVIAHINKDNKNIKMIIYPLDLVAVPIIIMNFGTYENEEMDITLKLLNLLDKDSVIFDIGANIGWYTLNILKDMETRYVYSFEPIKETYLKLEEILKVNNLENYSIYNYGLYNENKNLEFFYDTLESGASSIADLRERDTTKKVSCIVKKMDDFINDNCINRLDFIKCDVEGAELFVYRGGIESIKKFKPIIFSEMLRKWSAKFNYHPNDIIDLLEGIGYKCFVIDDKKLRLFEKVDEETIETNYFFLHKEKHSNIINNNDIVKA